MLNPTIYSVPIWLRNPFNYTFKLLYFIFKDIPIGGGPEDVSETKAEPQKRDWPWKRAKKVAVMISFCGKDYLGMQRFVCQLISAIFCNTLLTN